MKRAILILAAFILGAVLGGYVSHFTTVVRYGMKQSRISRVYEEASSPILGAMRSQHT